MKWRAVSVVVCGLGLVLDHNGLLQIPAEIVTDHTRLNVGWAARGVGDDQPDRAARLFRRVGLRRGEDEAADHGRNCAPLHAVPPDFSCIREYGIKPPLQSTEPPFAGQHEYFARHHAGEDRFPRQHEHDKARCDRAVA